MAATDNLNGQQISYRMVRDLEAGRGGIKHSVLAHHPEHGVVGVLNLTNEHWRSGYGRPLPPPEKAGGRGLSIGLANVDPRLQRQGIGTAMYHIATMELGYAPEHDIQRTALGNKFAQSVSGREGGRGGIPGGAKAPYAMPGWQIDVPDEGPTEMAKIQQPNWERGTDIDQTWANAVTPVKQKRRRAPKQEQLFDTTPYDAPKPQRKRK